MIKIAIILGVGIGAFLLWHYRRQQQIAQQPIYLGAPAWPTMPPIPVNDISLPGDLQQADTSYGVPQSWLEAFTK